MAGDSLSMGRLDAGPRPSSLWRRDLADVLLAAVVLLALALISVL
jgi:hypothetical protein